jgi:hypothetical protein
MGSAAGEWGVVAGRVFHAHTALTPEGRWPCDPLTVGYPMHTSLMSLSKGAVQPPLPLAGEGREGGEKHKYKWAPLLTSFLGRLASSGLCSQSARTLKYAYGCSQIPF